MAEAEEVLDLFFYRPIAFVFVKTIYRLPVTPNQVTFLSLLAGFASAWCFAQGTVSGFAFAGMWYAIANVLDCADGMLARLQNSGSPFGRLVDGVADWALSVAIFVGVGVGLTKYTGDPSMWWLAAAGGFTSALHAIVFDYRQQAYIAAIKGKANFLADEFARAEKELQRSEESGVWIGKRLALQIYLRYMALQARSDDSGEKRLVPPELFRTYNAKPMRWWTILGATTNRTGLILAALAGDPGLFCWIVATAGNVYLIGMLLWQRAVQHRLDLALETVSAQEEEISA